MFGWGIKSVTIDQLAEKLSAGTPVLIDVREPHEYAGGHVPGARNFPLGQLQSRLGELDPHAETFVICRSGSRSVTGTKLLKKAGFERVYNVKGGTMAWPGKLKR